MNAFSEADVSESPENETELHPPFPRLFWVNRDEFSNERLEESDSEQHLKRLKGSLQEWLSIIPSFATQEARKGVLDAFREFFFQNLKQNRLSNARLHGGSKIALGSPEKQLTNELFNALNRSATFHEPPKEGDGEEEEEDVPPSQTEGIPASSPGKEEIINSPFSFDPDNSYAVGLTFASPPKRVSSEVLGFRTKTIIARALEAAGSSHEEPDSFLAKNLEILKSYVFQDNKKLLEHLDPKRGPPYSLLYPLWTLLLLEKENNWKENAKTPPFSFKFRSFLTQTVPWLINRLQAGSPQQNVFVRWSFGGSDNLGFRTFLKRGKKTFALAGNAEDWTSFVKNATERELPERFWTMSRKSADALAGWLVPPSQLRQPLRQKRPESTKKFVESTRFPPAPSVVLSLPPPSLLEERPPQPKAFPQSIQPKSQFDTVSKGFHLSRFFRFVVSSSSSQRPGTDPAVASVDWTNSESRLVAMVGAYLQAFGVRWSVFLREQNENSVRFVVFFHDETIAGPSESSAELAIEIESPLHRSGWTVLAHRHVDRSPGARLSSWDVRADSPEARFDLYANFGVNSTDTFRTTLLGTRNCFSRTSFAPLALVSLLLNLEFSQGFGAVPKTAEISWNGQNQPHLFGGGVLPPLLRVKRQFVSAAFVVWQQTSSDLLGDFSESSVPNRDEDGPLIIICGLLDLMSDGQQCTERIFALSDEFCADLDRGLREWLLSELERQRRRLFDIRGPEREETSDLDVETPEPNASQEGSVLLLEAAKDDLIALLDKLERFKNLRSAFRQAFDIATKEEDGLSAVCTENAISQATDEHVERLIDFGSLKLSPEHFVSDLLTWEHARKYAEQLEKDESEAGKISFDHWINRHNRLNRPYEVSDNSFATLFGWKNLRGALSPLQFQQFSPLEIYWCLKMSISQKIHHSVFEEALAELTEICQKCASGKTNLDKMNVDYLFALEVDLDYVLKLLMQSKTTNLESTIPKKQLGAFSHYGKHRMSVFFNLMQPSLESTDFALARKIEWYASYGIESLLGTSKFSQWFEIVRLQEESRQSSAANPNPLVWLLRKPRAVWSPLVPILALLNRDGEMEALSEESLPLEGSDETLRISSTDMKTLHRSGNALLGKVRLEAEARLKKALLKTGTLVFGGQTLTPDEEMEKREGEEEEEEPYQVHSENNLEVLNLSKSISEADKARRKKSTRESIVEKHGAPEKHGKIKLVNKLLRINRFYERVHAKKHEAVLKNYLEMLILLLTVLNRGYEEFKFYPAKLPQDYGEKKDDLAEKRNYSDYDAFLQQFYNRSRRTRDDKEGTPGEFEGTVGEMFGRPTISPQSKGIVHIATLLDQLRRVFVERWEEGNAALSLSDETRRRTLEDPSFVLRQVTGTLNRALRRPLSAYKSYGDLAFSPSFQDYAEIFPKTDQDKLYDSSLFGIAVEQNNGKFKADNKLSAGRAPLFRDLLRPLEPGEKPLSAGSGYLAQFVQWSHAKKFDDPTRGCNLPIFSRSRRFPVPASEYFEQLQDELFEFLLLFHCLHERLQENKFSARFTKKKKTTKKRKTKAKTKFDRKSAISSLFEKLSHPESKIGAVRSDFLESVSIYEKLKAEGRPPDILDYFGNCSDYERPNGRLCAFDWMCVGVWSCLTDEKKSHFKEGNSPIDIFGSPIESKFSKDVGRKYIPYVPSKPPGKPKKFSLPETFFAAKEEMEARGDSTALESLYLSWILCRKAKHAFKDFYEHGPLFGRYNIGAEGSDREPLHNKCKPHAGQNKEEISCRAFSQFGIATFTEIPKKISSIEPSPSEKQLEKNSPQRIQNVSKPTFSKLAQNEGINWDRFSKDESGPEESHVLEELLNKTRIYPVYGHYGGGEKQTYSNAKAVMLQWFKDGTKESENTETILSPFLVDSDLGPSYATMRFYDINEINEHAQSSRKNNVPAFPSPVQVANRCSSLSGKFTVKPKPKKKSKKNKEEEEEEEEGEEETLKITVGNSNFFEDFPVFVWGFVEEKVLSFAKVVARASSEKGPPGSDEKLILNVLVSVTSHEGSKSQSFSHTVFWVPLNSARMGFFGNLSLFVRFWKDEKFWRIHKSQAILEKNTFNAFQCSLLQEIVRWRSDARGWNREGSSRYSTQAASSALVEVAHLFSFWLKKSQISEKRASSYIVPDPGARNALPTTFVASVECRSRCLPSLAPIGLCPLFFDRKTATLSPKEPFLRFYDSPAVPSPAAEPHRTPLDALVVLGSFLRAVSSAQSAIPWCADGTNAEKLNKLTTVVNFLRSRYSTGHVWNNALSVEVEDNDVSCYRIRECGYFSPFNSDAGGILTKSEDSSKILCVANLVLKIPNDYFSPLVSVDDLSLEVSSGERDGSVWFSFSPKPTSPVLVKNNFGPSRVPPPTNQKASFVQSAPYATDSSGAPKKNARLVSDNVAQIAKEYLIPDSTLTSQIIVKNPDDPNPARAEEKEEEEPAPTMDQDLDNEDREYLEELLEALEAEPHFSQALEGPKRIPIEGGEEEPSEEEPAEKTPQTLSKTAPITQNLEDKTPPILRRITTELPPLDAGSFSSFRVVPSGLLASSEFRSRVFVRPAGTKGQHVLPSFGPRRLNMALFIYADAKNLANIPIPRQEEKFQTSETFRNKPSKRHAPSDLGSPKKMRTSISKMVEFPPSSSTSEIESLNVLKDWQKRLRPPKLSTVNGWLERVNAELKRDPETPLVWSSGYYLNRYGANLKKLFTGNLDQRKITDGVKIKQLGRGSLKKEIPRYSLYGLFLKEERGWPERVPEGTVVATFGGRFIKAPPLFGEKGPEDRTLPLVSRIDGNPETVLFLDGGHVNQLYLQKESIEARKSDEVCTSIFQLSFLLKYFRIL